MRGSSPFPGRSQAGSREQAPCTCPVCRSQPNPRPTSQPWPHVCTLPLERKGFISAKDPTHLAIWKSFSRSISKNKVIAELVQIGSVIVEQGAEEPEGKVYNNPLICCIFFFFSLLRVDETHTEARITHSSSIFKEITLNLPPFYHLAPFGQPRGKISPALSSGFQ